MLKSNSLVVIPKKVRKLAFRMMALTPKRLFLYLCISISLLRPYTLFSRSPLVNKTLFGFLSDLIGHDRVVDICRGQPARRRWQDDTMVISCKTMHVVVV